MDRPSTGRAQEQEAVRQTRGRGWVPQVETAFQGPMRRLPWLEAEGTVMEVAGPAGRGQGHGAPTEQTMTGKSPRGLNEGRVGVNFVFW